MKIIEHYKITYTLILTQEEQEWLLLLMQNPLQELETQPNKVMREKFFSTLKGGS